MYTVVNVQSGPVYHPGLTGSPFNSLQVYPQVLVTNNGAVSYVPMPQYPTLSANPIPQYQLVGNPQVQYVAVPINLGGSPLNSVMFTPNYEIQPQAPHSGPIMDMHPPPAQVTEPTIPKANNASKKKKILAPKVSAPGADVALGSTKKEADLSAQSYLRDVPLTMTATDVGLALSSVLDGVKSLDLMPTNKKAHKGYGYVTFQTPEAMHRACQREIVLGNQTTKMEPRRTPNHDSSMPYHSWEATLESSSESVGYTVRKEVE